ncbi:hypothetical protein D3C87_372080 [compost metagenome]
MTLAYLGDFRGTGVKAELRADKAHQSGVFGGQAGQVHLDGTAAQLGVADKILAAFLLEQKAGAFAIQQQDGGKQILRDAVQRALDHPRRELRARGGAGQQGGSQAVFFQRQARRQGLRGCRDAMQAGDFNQAVQQGVVVRGASVRTPFPGGHFR